MNSKTAKYVLIIVIITLAVFGNSFRNGFVLDDKFIIEKNRTIRSLSNIPNFFSSDYWAGTRYEGESSALYRPLVITSYALDYAVWKLNPTGYHVLNLLLHILNCLLIFYFVWIFLEKNMKAALFTGLLFAVHPVHVEAVTGIVGRAEVAAVFFLLVSLLAYGAKEKLPRFKHGYLVSLLFFGLALLTKETALTLPGIIVLYDLYRFKGVKELKTRAVKYAGYLGVILGYFLLRLLVFGSVFSSAGKGFFYRQTTATRLLTMSKVFVSYIKLLVYPVGLKGDYSNFPFSSSPDLAVILSILVVAAAVYLLFRSYSGKKTVFLSLGWYLLCLAPVSNIIPFGAVMAERFLYLPSVGFCLLAGLLIMEGRGAPGEDKQMRYGIFTAIIIVLLAAGTIKYNARWYSNDTLWNYAVKKSPDNARVHYAMGVVHLENREYDKAIKEFELGIKMDPYMPEAYNNLSVCYNNLGMNEKAVAISRKALEHKPDYYEAYINMGNAFRNMNKTEEAIGAYSKAIEINPRSADAHYNLGLSHYGLKDYDSALSNFSNIVDFDVEYESAWLGIGGIYIERGNFRAAINELREAASYLPRSAEIADRLGLAYFRRGEYEKAIIEFKRSLKLKPGNVEVINQLGSSYGNMKRYKEALIEFKKALEIDPSFAEARENYNKLTAIGIK